MVFRVGGFGHKRGIRTWERGDSDIDTCYGAKMVHVKNSKISLIWSYLYTCVTVSTNLTVSVMHFE